MKHLIFSTCTIIILSIISVSGFSDTLKVDKLKSKIEQYVKTIDHSEVGNSATIYTHFLVKEEGFIYTVDFMLTDNDKITILTKDIEEEYYRVDLFNAQYVEKYSVPMPTIEV